ncbi:MAG: three-Cys-motif partner protein TcmP [Proteobacteria bacterium]|nr:three-Cys-motif partner protein TcmP [Pseudomonadota bacterium]
MNAFKYGGPWTQIKVNVLADYLRFYTSALKDQKFELLYIDGFAGSGERSVDISDGGLIDHADEMTLEGSAKKALNTDPPFDKYIFIENTSHRYAALISLCDEYPNRKIEVIKGDANKEVSRICNETVWRGPGSPGHGRRAVLFLDPFGMDVHWNTLKSVARTEAIDLWYRFPMEGLYRQAARDLAKVDQAKAAAVDRILGTQEWVSALYEKPSQSDLFDTGPEAERVADVKAMEGFVKKRLEDIFASVADPLPLPKTGGPQKFSLFFAVSNREPPAIGLSMRVAEHILGKA